MSKSKFVHPDIYWARIRKEQEEKNNIYERNPSTGKVYKRKVGDYSKRELVKNETIDNSMEMISLYDYLGRAAGSDLGKQVAIAAAKAGLKSEIREVSNSKYTGPIMLYPRAFLDLYFKNGLTESTNRRQLLKG